MVKLPKKSDIPRPLFADDLEERFLKNYTDCEHPNTEKHLYDVGEGWVGGDQLWLACFECQTCGEISYIRIMDAHRLHYENRMSQRYKPLKRRLGEYLRPAPNLTQDNK